MREREGLRHKIGRLVSSRRFNHIITGLIIINAILIGIETYPTIYDNYRLIFITLDWLILTIFTIEIALKIFASRLEFFKNNWNNFDFIIVLGSLIFYTTPFVSVLRIFRVLRVLRAITAFPKLRRVVSALLMAIPTIMSVIVIMMIVFYVYAIIGTAFYAEVAPEYFGNLQRSFITLFQIFTLDSWASGLYRPLFSEIVSAWFYFVSFIVIATFIMINLIVGEIVNNAQKISEEIGEDTREIKADTSEIESLRADVQELKTMLQQMLEREKMGK